jgi:nitrogen-specific signal transduction histidine kinase/CheY-like chemotaxis protein
VPGPDAASTQRSSEPADRSLEPARLSQDVLNAQKLEAIGRLVPGLKHEFNNRLAAILAVSNLIQTDSSLPTELRKYADGLTEEAHQANRLVKGLMDLVATDAGDHEPASLAEIVAGVLDVQSHAFRPGWIEAIVEIADDIPSISMNRRQIEQVLINLTLIATQAIRTRSGRGVVRIVAARVPAIDRDGSAPDSRGADRHDVVRLSITDDGPGIPEELRSRLFDPSVATTSPSAGSGLGLAVSRAIAVEHGGDVRYEPGPNGIGSTFVLELPVEADAAPRPPEPSGAAAPDTRPDTAGPEARRPDSARPDTPVAARPRILILDDEGSIRDFLSRILQRNGFDPVVAVDGASALEIVRTNPPEAILCDHRMAAMSGVAFHEAVAALNPRLARRFAFMSGDVLNPELQEFATANDIVVLAKPFDIESATSIVARLVAATD